MTHNPQKPEKAADIPVPKPGDVVRLPGVSSEVFCLIVMDDFQGNKANGVYYLPIRALNKKGYKGQNSEGETYHLTQNDLDAMRDVTRKGEFRLSAGQGAEAKVFRLEYDLKHYEFNDGEAGFFIKVAKAQGTKFFHRAIQVTNQIILKQQGISLQVEETNPQYVPSKRQRSPAERDAMKASVPTRVDLSLEDAKKDKFILPATYKVLSQLKHKSGDSITLGEAFKLVNDTEFQAKGYVGKAFAAASVPKSMTLDKVQEDIKFGWRLFMEQLSDPENYDFSETKTSFPIRKLALK